MMSLKISINETWTETFSTLTESIHASLIIFNLSSGVFLAERCCSCCCAAGGSSIFRSWTMFWPTYMQQLCELKRPKNPQKPTEPQQQKPCLCCSGEQSLSVGLNLCSWTCTHAESLQPNKVENGWSLHTRPAYTLFCCLTPAEGGVLKSSSAQLAEGPPSHPPQPHPAIWRLER